MFTEIMKRKSNNAIQKLYELDNEIEGYKIVIVSIKDNGIDGLMGSYFIFGTHDGVTLEKELSYDIDKCNYTHDQVLFNFIGKTVGQDLRIYGKEYYCWREGNYIGKAIWTDDENVGSSFLNKIINDTNEEAFEVYMPDKWCFIK